MTTHTHVRRNGSVIEQTIVVDHSDDVAVARRFFDLLAEREIEATIVDYRRRIEDDRPYEDAGSVDDLRRSVGR